MGHDVGKPSATIGGGMSMVMFTGGGEEEAEEERAMVGACCWRADGTPMGMAGGYAMSGARFSTGGLDVSACLAVSAAAGNGLTGLFDAGQEGTRESEAVVHHALDLFYFLKPRPRLARRASWMRRPS